ncbi:NAD(P)/FAD-dependent oxidoreductase [Pseudoalteromonas piscicida]|uniref:phytoene desaturase family protein n=1 Tax=Pseudoalteromonas piscicida TaxID=43662 RepID=UPI001D0AE3D5|nr:NAD(P)/FAD-dependent oxidoreductase [Pseudoalteromonas piscicida]UDM61565.1 NAD(P)/FAD-dependent oxidoreductase [Pseudoalteromonas piscicida]
MTTQRQSMIIIGAGMGGLSTGSYAQMNGYKSVILELHDIPGGCCTSWERRDYIFDWCISWLLGSGSGNGMNQIWQELGALDDKEIRDFEIFNSVIDEELGEVHFYADPDKLEAHLLSISPADKKLIKQFCDGIREFVKMIDAYPFLVPVGIMSRWQKLKMMWPFIKKFNLIRKSMATLMSDFAAKFSHPLLQKAFNVIFYEQHPSFPLLPFYFNLACAAKKNAGVPEGGSLGLAQSMEARYKKLGGDIIYNTRVHKILVEDNKAIGVELSDGQKMYADIVISACDGTDVVKNMLDGQYSSPVLDKLYDELRETDGQMFPGYVSVFLGVNKDYTHHPHCRTHLLEQQDLVHCPGMTHPGVNVQVRNVHYPHIAPEGKSVLYITYFSTYEPWAELNNFQETTATKRHHTRVKRSVQYRLAKKTLGEFIIDKLSTHFEGLKEHIEYIDIATPLTQVRYTRNSKGTVLAWQPFLESGESLEDEINANGTTGLPGLSNFYMAGHWVTTGGLIRAAATGRHVLHFVCRDDDKPFQAWIGENPLHQPQSYSEQKQHVA